MRYGSVCSGIEAATAAWHHMGWEPAFFSEIEKFPRAVLEHHYPEVPLHGDFTTIEQNQYGKIDLLVGGTPCQSFSIAGLRGGLDDERGNLALEFCRLAQREQPRWIVWENVPGVLSSSGGRDFGSILGALEDLGYGLAYRVLDAQYFGVAQRRRRVFVVGYLGDWRPAAAVLFERHSMSGHLAPSREARKDVAPTISARTKGGGGLGTDFDCDGGLVAGGRVGPPVTEIDVVGTLRTKRPGEGGNQGGDFLVTPFDTTQITSPHNYSNPKDGDPCHPLAAGAHAPAVAYSFKPRQSEAAGGIFVTEEYSPTLQAANNGSTAVPAVAYAIQPVTFEWQRGATQNMEFTTELSPALIKSQTPAYYSTYAIQAVSPALNPNSGPDGVGVQKDHAYTWEARAEVQVVSFQPRIGRNGRGYSEGAVPTLTGADAGATSDMRPCVATTSAVRRLTPVECERLQGFPDGFTAIPWRKKDADDCPDGPRYKALGNSMAVPVMRWIGERIQLVDDFISLI